MKGRLGLAEVDKARSEVQALLAIGKRHLVVPALAVESNVHPAPALALVKAQTLLAEKLLQYQKPLKNYTNFIHKFY